MQFAWKIGVVMLVALVLVVLPGGGNALDVILTLLSIAFLAAIAFLGYRLFRQYHFDIETLEPNMRLVLYGSIASGEEGENVGTTALVIATFLAFVSGYAAIAFLLRFLATHTMVVFVVYRVALGILVLALVSAGTIE